MPKAVNPRGRAAKPPGGDVAPAPRKRAAKKSAAPAPKPESTIVYIRNIRGILARITLDTGRTIYLQPRGQRGDLAPISVDEQHDSIFLQNLGLLYEVVTVEQATEIITKQNTNIAQGYDGHNALDVLTDEHGNPITKVTVQQPFEQQGTVIATIEQGPGGRHTESTEIIHRGAGPAAAPVPGSIHNPVVDSQNKPVEYADPISQAIAEGGSLNVSVNPPQRS